MRRDVPEALAGELAGLAARESAEAPPQAPPGFDGEYRRLLGMGAAPAEVYVAFVIGGDRPGKKQPEVADIAMLDRRSLAGFPELVTDLEIGRPGFAVIRDGRAVAVAFTARSGEDGAEAGVETLPAYRGRGYATAVARAWGGAVRRSGRIAFYSAAAGNTASLAVGRKLAGAPYAVMTHYRRTGR